MKKITLTIITIATLISGCGDPAAERAAAEAKKEAVEAERAAAEAKKAAVEAERSLSEVKQAVLVGLKDPDSAKFGKLTKVGDNYACLDVNAKNTFGGYTGMKTFALIRENGEWSVVTAVEFGHPLCVQAIQKMSEPKTASK